MTKRKKKQKSFISKLFSKRILLLIQLISSVIFLGYVYVLKMLPLKFYFVLLGIIVILFLLTNIFMRSGIKKSKKEGKVSKLIISKLTCLLLSIVLLFGSVMIYRGNSFLSNITGALTQTRSISVFVLKDSDYASLDDIKDKEVGFQYAKGSSTIGSAMNAIEKEMGSTLNTKEYDDYAALGDAIVNKEVDAIIVDQAYMALLEANHEGLDESLKAIYTVSTEEKVKAITKETDVTSNPFIVYVTGIDTYGSVSTISRSDVNLLVCVSPKQKQILMVSIPRDTEVNLHKNGKMDKLTHSAMYGIDETISTIEDFLDLDVNYFAKTNFSGITNIIDALGGVTIDSPYDFTTLHGNYHITKGEQEMDGDKALCFVRERYSLPNGDFDRGKNQQRLLKAMIKKAISPKIITNYSNILAAVEGCFETNMDSDDIKSLVNMQLDKGGAWQMYNVQVTGEGRKTSKTYSMYGQSVYTMPADKEKLQGIIDVVNKIEAGKKITDSDVKGLD